LCNIESTIEIKWVLQEKKFCRAKILGEVLIDSRW